MSINEAYRAIDLHGSGGLWPPTIPAMTGPEAVAASKKLWRKFAGRAWPGTWKTGRGNHRFYPRGTVMIANPGLGWQRLTHDISHCLYQHLTRSRHSVPRLWVKGVPHPILSKAVFDDYKTAKQGEHTDSHAQLEKAMVRYVIEQGWLDGKLRKPVKEAASKPKPDRREQNETKVDAAITRWTDKQKKAQKAVVAAEKRLKELAVKKRYYERQRAK